ncbi:MAG: RDD family protein [Verrucomicrobia bacterium]|nr:RDD family protein [Verrucomicrobiota bacterium]
MALLLAMCATPAFAQTSPQDVIEKVQRHLESRGIMRAESPGGEAVRIAENLVVAEGDHAGDAVVVLGDAQIDGEVRALVVVLGNATLGPTAHVLGDAVIIGGNLKVDAKSLVDREVFVIGGELQAPEDALIRKRTVEFHGLDLSAVKWSDDWAKQFPALKMAVDWATYGLLMGRPIPPKLGWIWNIVAVFVFINVILAVLFPKPVQACADALERRPIGSFFAGLLTLMLFGPVVALLLFTGVGILVIPFVLCAMSLALLFGKVAVYRYAGQQLGRQLHLGFLQLPLVALLAGMALLYLLYMIPLVGFLAWGLFTMLGVGNATIAAVGGMRRENSGTIPVAAPPAEAGAAPPPLSQSNAWPRVGFWRRFVALALDALLLFVVIFVVASVLHLHQPIPLLLLAWLIYHLAMWTALGTTVGGMAMRLKIVRTDGRPIGFAVALVRALASVFSALALFVGFFWAGWSREKRSWHDYIAGTIVVKPPPGVAVV